MSNKNKVTVIPKETTVNDVVKVITGDVKENNKPDDYSDCTTKEIENIKEMQKLIAEIESPAITNVLDNLTFKTDIDKMIFDRLPLTTNQKEYLLLSVNTEHLKEDVPKEHGAIIPKK